MLSQGNFAKGKIGRSATAEPQIENLRLGTMGKLCLAKIVLGVAKPPLRIRIGGAVGPSKLPRGFCTFVTTTTVYTPFPIYKFM